MNAAPTLSLILPAYRAASDIAANVSEVIGVLERLEDPFEILVVCDGCAETRAAAEEIADERVRVLHYPTNRGKGYAICFGVAHAHGRLIGWLDADLDISPEFILEAEGRFRRRQIDAVIGSKRHRDSQVQYPWKRRFLSWGFQLLVRLMFRVNVRDTQVGAKLFRGEMLATVAPLLLIKHFAFDLEVLAVGAEFGFDRIEEAPVKLEYRFTGTGIGKEAVQRMFLDTLAIAYRIHIRHWYVRQFAALERRRTDAGAAAGVEPPVPAGTWSEILSVRG